MNIKSLLIGSAAALAVICGASIASAASGPGGGSGGGGLHIEDPFPGSPSIASNEVGLITNSDEIGVAPQLADIIFWGGTKVVAPRGTSDEANGIASNTRRPFDDDKYTGTGKKPTPPSKPYIPGPQLANKETIVAPRGDDPGSIKHPIFPWGAEQLAEGSGRLGKKPIIPAPLVASARPIVKAPIDTTL